MKKLFLIIVVLNTILFFSSCSDDDTGSPDDIEQVKLSSNTSLGNFLIDNEGRTLYFFTRDVNGSSNCTEGCTTTWPVFSDEVIKVTSELDLSDFAAITRADGSKQTTYKGWPLYYFSGDAKAGDTKGDGTNELWFVGKPDYSVMLGDQVVSAFGDDLTKYITDPEGRTLYYYTEDDTTNFVSKCTEGCLDTWPIQEGIQNLILPSTLKLDLFDVITRNDGSSQLTYRNRPMYFFTQDDLRGEISGHNVTRGNANEFKFILSRLSW